MSHRGKGYLILLSTVISSLHSSVDNPIWISREDASGMNFSYVTGNVTIRRPLQGHRGRWPNQPDTQRTENREQGETNGHSNIPANKPLRGGLYAFGFTTEKRWPKGCFKFDM